MSQFQNFGRDISQPNPSENAEFSSDYESTTEQILALQARNADLEQQLNQLRQRLADSEAQRHAADAKLHQILDSAIAAIASFRAFSDREWEYEYRSAGCEIVFGYRAEEFLADKDLWRSRVLPEDWDRVIVPAIAQIFANQETTNSVQSPTQIEYRFQHKDGGLRWISETFTVQWDEATNGWLITTVATDITDRKLFEADLLHSRDLVQRITDDLPQLLYIFDLVNQRNIYVNRQIQAILGYTHEELNQQGAAFFVDHLYRDHLPLLLQVVENWANVADGEVVEQEYKMRHKDGSWRWLRSREVVFERDQAGRPTKTLGTAVDITDRKRAEEAIKASERRFHAVFNQTFQLSSLLNPDGTILEDNQTAAEFCQLPSSESTGQLFWNLHCWRITPDTQERLRQAIARAAEGHTVRYEEDIWAPDHSVITIDFSIKPLINEAGQVELLIAEGRDLTERKAAEARLRQYAQIVSATSDGIVLIGRDYCYRLANQAYLDKFNRRQDDLVGRSVREIRGEELFASVIKPYLDRALAGEIVQYEIWHGFSAQNNRFLSITYAPYRELDGSISGAVASIRDLTELKQTEAALRQSEQRYALAVNAGKAGVWDLDLETNDIYIDPALKALLGYEDWEIRNHLDDWSTLVHPEDQSTVTAAIEAHLAGQTPVFEVEHRMIHKDGSIRWLLARGTAMRDANGKPYRVTGTDLDIGDRKWVEIALRRQLEKEQTLNGLIQAIRNFLDLNILFSSVVAEVAQVLSVDQVGIIQYHPEARVWRFVEEYLSRPEIPSTRNLEVTDRDNEFTAQIKQRAVVRVNDTGSLDPADEIHSSLARLLPGAWLVVPLHMGAKVWGALELMQYGRCYTWQDEEVELAQAVADQIAIAIHQSELYQQVQGLNANLEQQVETRTAELQAALRREAMLKGITEAVRNSLDEAEILQTVVQELSHALGGICCTTALYDRGRTVSTINYDYALCCPSAQFRTISMQDYALEFQQLLRGQVFQFCFLRAIANPIYDDLAYCSILVCPIRNEQEVFGDLWLFKPVEQSFDESDLQLVEQVANQCAIALRQSWLYQAIQSHAEELESLNRLKDDFLSTVSHELRSPMANIRMATQMLEVFLAPRNVLDNRSSRYFQILKDECERESNLIDDLLDLSRLESGQIELRPIALNLYNWVPCVAEPFEERTQNQQQQLLYQFAPDLPVLITDAFYLERILTELLHNACKYTPAQERIIVAAEMSTNPDQAPEPVQNLVKHLKLSVTNTGVEIPEQERDRIFEKFYRIPNNDPWKYGGTGLGLALVKKLVECLGGTLELERTTGQTTFTLKLPLT